MTNARKLYSADEICRIITMAGVAGVAELKFGDFECKFSPKPASKGLVNTPDLPKTDDTPIYAAQASEQTLAIDDTLQTVDKALLEDMRLSQLMLDDPLAFEQEVIDAHLGGPRNASVQN